MKSQVQQYMQQVVHGSGPNYIGLNLEFIPKNIQQMGIEIKLYLHKQGQVGHFALLGADAAEEPTEKSISLLYSFGGIILFPRFPFSVNRFLFPLKITESQEQEERRKMEQKINVL